MGPIELQLYRELAVQIVRACAGYLQETDDEPYDLDLQRLWFDRLYEAWASTPRSELDGRTPTEAIREERARLGLAGELDPDLSTQMEFYTDLPQPGASIEGEWRDDAAPDEALEPADARADTPPDGQRPLSAGEQTRWEGFRDRYLRGWLDDRLE